MGKDAVAILARRDELQEEEPPLEALRVWASLRDLKQAAEHEAEAKARMKPDPAAYREDRKRRDAFVEALKVFLRKGLLTAETSWHNLQAAAENDRNTGRPRGYGTRVDGRIPRGPSSR